MERVRVVHSLNQFFGGFGAEEKANTPVEVRGGPVGPGRALQHALGRDGQVVATPVGGDNDVAERRHEALATVRTFIILVLVRRWFMKGLTEGAITW